MGVYAQLIDISKQINKNYHKTNAYIISSYQ
jgi:hypothetical protein